MLKGAETKPFSFRTTNPRIPTIVQHIDILVAITRILRSNKETVTIHVHRPSIQFNLPCKDLKKRKPALITLVRHNQHENGLGGKPNNQFDKGHDQQIQTFPRNILIDRSKQKDILREAQGLPSQITGNGAKHGRVHSMIHHIYRTCNTMGLQHIFPAFGKTENAFYIAIQCINHALRRGSVGHVHVGPDLEETLLNCLANMLNVGTNHG